MLTVKLNRFETQWYDTYIICIQISFYSIYVVKMMNELTSYLIWYLLLIFFEDLKIFLCMEDKTATIQSTK